MSRKLTGADVASTRRSAAVGLVASGAGVALLIAAAVADRSIEDPAHHLPLLLLAAGSAFWLAASWALVTLASHHFRDLRQLEATIEGLSSETAVLALADSAGNDEVERLRRVIARLLSLRVPRSLSAESRLAAVLATIPEGIVVVNDTGLITLVNPPARDRFGSGRMAVGTSLFDVFEREPWDRAFQRATRSDGALATTLQTVDGEALTARISELPGHNGAVIALPQIGAATGAVVHALHLHDTLPAPKPPRPDTPLDALDVVVLDLETTGVDVLNDRVISIGAVRVRGTRVYHHIQLDLLVDPQRPIPPASTRIHGIVDEMVRGAPSLADVWPQLMAFIDNAAIVGHSVGFDIAMLARRGAETGLRWPGPPSLCTMQLMAALEPTLTNLDLESIAQWLGVSVTGRHTALGDALVTADVYVRLVARMLAAGYTDLQAAQAVAATAKRVIRRQKAAGW